MHIFLFVYKHFVFVFKSLYSDLCILLVLVFRSLYSACSCIQIFAICLFLYSDHCILRVLVFRSLYSACFCIQIFVFSIQILVFRSLYFIFIQKQAYTHAHFLNLSHLNNRVCRLHGMCISVEFSCGCMQRKSGSQKNSAHDRVRERERETDSVCTSQRECSLSLALSLTRAHTVASAC